MFLKILLTILFLVSSISAQQTSFKVWNANVQHGIGTDGATDYARQSAILIGSNSDIVFMQERSTNSTTSCAPCSDSSWNSTMTGFTEVVYRENGHGNDGPSIWLKNGITLNNTYQTDLSSGAIGWDGSTNVDKSAVGIQITINGKTFYLFNTHLAWSAGADCNGCQTSAIREGQINTLLAWINSIVGSNPNWILGGDMNLSPTMPKISGGFQIDLFTSAGLSSVRALGTANGYFTVNWGDRNSDSIPDNSVTAPRTHDTREIDYIFTNNSATLFEPIAIDLPDLRATCPHALVAGGAMPSCSPEVIGGPNVSGQQADTEDDFGVKPSDHNFLLATFNIGPIANFTLPSTAFVGEPVIADGSSSVGVNGQVGWSTETFSDGTTPVTWNFGDNLGTYSTPKKLKETHVYFTAGTYNVCLEVKDSARNTDSICHDIIISNIPAATGVNIRTLTEQGSPTANKDHFQSVWNTAAANNTVEQEIHIPNSMQITGVVTAPTTYAGNKYITIRPVDISFLPTALNRVNPTIHAANMPKISSPQIDVTQLEIPANSKYVKLLGLEFNKQAGHLYQLIAIGTNVSSYSNIPHHIIIDRCYIKGNPFDDTGRGIYVNADSFSLINSYISDMHDTGADAQAIAGFAGSGIGIINNYLNGLGENIMFGGANGGINFQSTVSVASSSTNATLTSVSDLRVGDGISFTVSSGSRGPWSASIVRSISGNDITFDQITNSSGVPTAPDTTSNAVKYGSSPQNIVIARNYLYKSLIYRTVDPLYNGTYSPVVKNSFELKHAMNVTFDGNIVENNWGNQGQSGPTILFSPRNQTCYLLVFPHDPATCPEQINPWTMVRDVQFSNNYLVNLSDYMNIIGTDNLNPPGTGDESGPSAHVQYIYVANNLIQDLDSNRLNGSAGAVLWMFPGVKHFTFTHHTAINDASASAIGSEAAPIGTTSSDVKFVNNIMRYGEFGFVGAVSGNPFMTTFWPDGLLTHNVISDELNAATPADFFAPLSGPNYFPATLLTDTLISESNPRLQATSPYKAGNATPAADETDIGVNLDIVNASTANVVSGVWASGTIKKCKWGNSPKCNQ